MDRSMAETIEQSINPSIPIGNTICRSATMPSSVRQSITVWSSSFPKKSVHYSFHNIYIYVRLVVVLHERLAGLVDRHGRHVGRGSRH